MHYLHEEIYTVHEALKLKQNRTKTNKSISLHKYSITVSRVLHHSELSSMEVSHERNTLTIAQPFGNNVVLRES